MRKKSFANRLHVTLMLIFCLSVFATTPSYGQYSVSGFVKDVFGEPIIGANVVEKGTTNGTITDIDGKFSFTASKEVVTLSVSYIGYQSVEYEYKGQGNAIITLEEDFQNLDEVVVVGYGVSKKQDLTGSIVSVKGDKIQETATFSAAQALQGRAAGVTVTTTSSVPGEDVTVRVRGNRSLKASNSPLYVVDGIPIVASLSEFSPSDIESIEVLKDASATAIYGSRGANGVILITTKKGKEGKVQVDYNGYVGAQTAARKLEYMNGAEWVEAVREANRNTTSTTPYPLVPNIDSDRNIGYFTADERVWSKIEMGYDEDGVWHSDRVPTVDWYDAALRTAPIQNHEISVRGGTEKLKLSASATYFGQDGIVKGQDYKRYSVRVNFDWTLNKYVTLGGSTSFSHIDKNQSIDLDGSNIDLIYPLADIYDENGTLITSRPGNDPQLWNLLLNLEHQKNEEKRDRFLGSYYVEANLPFDIKFRSNVGIDIRSTSTGEFYGTLSTDRQGGNPRAVNSGATRRMYTWENLLMYNKTFNQDHTLGVTLLQSIQQETIEDYSMSVQDLPYESQLWYNVGSAQTIESISSSYSRWRLASFMGRLNYNLRDKYLLTVSARYDGSSRLASGNKWVLFPSAALAWRMKEESFLKDVNFLSNLKMRLGWGITGNTAIDPYQTQGSLSYTRYTYGSSSVLGFYQNLMPNPELTWEKTAQWNLGLDYGFLNGRIGGSIDLYLQNTTDLLMDRQLPIVSGFESVTTNIGHVRNKGIEFALNTVNVDTKNFKWTTDFILAYNKEEIVELYNGKVDDVGNNWFIGQPLNVFYDYKFDGIWQLEDAEELEKWNGLFQPGDIKIVDRNGDYQITAEDRFILGHENPDVTLSLSNYFEYKNFDFNFFLTGALGQMKYFDMQLSFNGRYNSLNLNYWRIIGQDEDGNLISNQSNEAPRPSRDYESPNYVSSMYYKDASYVRIGLVTLGYSLPKKILSKVGMQRLRFYVTVQNPYVFTSYPGTDPESGSAHSEPAARTYLLGVNVSF